MSEPSVSADEPAWEELPKSRVIIVTRWAPSSDSVVLRSIETDLEFPANWTPTTSIYVMKVTSDGFLKIFAETKRENQSPWKGMHSYIPGKLLLKTSLSSRTAIVTVFSKLSADQKSLQQTGITIFFSISENGKVIFHFKISESQVFDTLEQVVPKLHTIFKCRSQSVLEAILSENTPEEAAVDEEENRRNNLDFSKFFKLFDIYKEKHKVDVPKYLLKSGDLNCNLMPYQKDTVRWMIHRENASCIDSKATWMSSEILPSSSLLYYPILGVLCRRGPKNEESLLKNLTLKGGILADEMGLGKTIQVLSLISAHRKNEQLTVLEGSEEVDIDREGVANLEVAEQIRIAEASHAELTAAKSSQTGVCYSLPDGSSSKSIKCSVCSQKCSPSVCGWNKQCKGKTTFVCPECVTQSGIRKEIGTTLIILPESLIFQWFTEISKHCSDRIKVMFYFGVKKHGYLQPCEMETYDVILTTYDTLRGETIFSESSSSQRIMRNEQKKLHLTSSLVHVKFWRVIVDESQIMPNGVNSKLAKMLLRIHADNWWCVTGTPLVKSVGDMESLFTFLDMLPFSSHDFFTQCVLPQYLHLAAREQLDGSLPHNLLLETLAVWMSRKTKESVETQLAIPELVEIEKTIQFSAIEERQYKHEKEQLRVKIETMLGHAPSNVLLSTHQCRDRVLQQLKTLREILVTGQQTRKLRGGLELGPAGLIFAPETVIFRLVHSKKTDILNHFRLFINYSLGLAGVHRLDRSWNEAMEAYSASHELYAELLDVERFIETTIGVEGIGKLIGDVDELEEEDEDGNIGDRTMTLSGWLRTVQTVLKKHEKKEEEDDGEEPASKKAKLEKEVVPLTEQEEASLQLEKEVQERENYARQQAQIALKPMRMDVTQHVHLILAKRSLRIASEEEVVLEQDDELVPVVRKFYKTEMDAVEILQKKLPVLNTIWGNYMEQMRGFFESFEIRCRRVAYPDALYELNDYFVIRPDVLENVLPRVPFLALVADRSKKSAAIFRHMPQTCMGMCVGWKGECKQFEMLSNVCLPLAEVVQKTWQHIRGLDVDRRRLDEFLRETVEFLTEMSEPQKFIDLLKTKDNRDARQKRLWKILECEHKIINGTQNDKEDILKERHEVEKYCDVCSLMYYCTKLKFDAGYSSFHGHPRQASGVVHLVAFLLEHYASSKSEGNKFMRTSLRPFFDRLDDAINVYGKSVLIMLEVVNRLHELFQASSLLTDEQILSGMSAAIDTGTARLSYRTSQIEQQTRARNSVRKDLGELRYLVNLMKEQMNGRETEEECPVCQTVMDSFMVFTCGHRVCQDCFETLKTLNRRDLMNPTGQSNTVSCPTCRLKNETSQVMIARSGHADKDQLIPGVVLSAKMTSAILLMREIIAADSENKIILFTNIDSSFSGVWKYLLRILKLAKLPFSPMTRSAYGKRVVDFEVSSDVKILLCSLSLCANGLNMTGANHIIFLDPPHLRPVLEQAIGRINRFGQKRAMKVFHLCVEGSLDEELRATAKKNYTREEEQNGWTVGEIRGMFGIAEPRVIRREEAIFIDEAIRVGIDQVQQEIQLMEQMRDDILNGAALLGFI